MRLTRKYLRHSHHIRLRPYQTLKFPHRLLLLLSKRVREEARAEKDGKWRFAQSDPDRASACTERGRLLIFLLLQSVPIHVIVRPVSSPLLRALPYAFHSFRSGGAGIDKAPRMLSLGSSEGKGKNIWSWMIAPDSCNMWKLKSRTDASQIHQSFFP